MFVRFRSESQNGDGPAASFPKHSQSFRLIHDQQNTVADKTSSMQRDLVGGNEYQARCSELDGERLPFDVRLFNLLRV